MHWFFSVCSLTLTLLVGSLVGKGSFLSMTRMSQTLEHSSLDTTKEEFSSATGVAEALALGWHVGLQLVTSYNYTSS